jgi:hypothetical protein
MTKQMGRPKTGKKPNTSVRVDPEVLHEARVAAVIQRKTLGRWLEEAIREKLERDQKEVKNSDSAFGKSPTNAVMLRSTPTSVDEGGDNES